MGEVEGGGDCDPNIDADRLLPRGALSGGGEHVQSQDGLAALCELNGTGRESREVEHSTVFGGENRQAGKCEK